MPFALSQNKAKINLLLTLDFLVNINLINPITYVDHKLLFDPKGLEFAV